MRDNRVLIIATVLVLLVLAVGYYLFIKERDRQLAVHQEVTAPIELEDSVLEEQSSGEVEVTLYFYRTGYDPESPDFLRPEERSLYRVEDPALMARQIVREVLRGSQKVALGEPEGEVEGPTLVPLTDRIRLRQLYLLEDGTALVDLGIENLRGTIVGITSELAVIKSITRSLKKNVPEVEQVRLLVNGSEQATLAGHVSIRRAFR